MKKGRFTMPDCKITKKNRISGSRRPSFCLLRHVAEPFFSFFNNSSGFLSFLLGLFVTYLLTLQVETGMGLSEEDGYCCILLPERHRFVP